MNRIDSPYYPPRARWYSPIFAIGYSIRRLTGLDHFHMPDAISAPAFIAGLLVPGVAFKVRKERLIGRAILLGWGLLAIVYLVWLGYPIANLAFGLMLSAHVTSILFLLNPWLAEARFGYRLMLSFLLLLVVGAGLYTPLRRQLQARAFMPLHTGQHVVIVQSLSPAHSVRRGDWIAYSVGGDGSPGLRINEGFGLRPVLATAGDHIRFTPKTFEINGIACKSLPNMPVTGELVVPEKHWFLWPEIAISGQGHTPEATIASAMLRLAIVGETQFIGKPYQRWFWRRQIFS